MKNKYRKINERRYSLADLIEVVNASAKNSKEAAATLMHLLNSGRVLLEKHGKLQRVRVA